MRNGAVYGDMRTEFVLSITESDYCYVHGDADAKST